MYLKRIKKIYICLLLGGMVYSRLWHASNTPNMLYLQSNNTAMADDKKVNKNQVNIELPEDISEGIYSNLAIIGHSQSEFVLDFVRMVPNVPKAKVKARIVITPQHAKRLAKALIDNINKYEAQHGKIGEHKQPEQQFPMNFTPTAQA